MLTNSDLIELTEFRRDLHRFPEISGEEEETARRIVAALGPLNPTRVLTGLGGHGVAAVFDSGKEGPTVMFRAELDGLPIEELSGNAWVSQVPGKGHLCGHDGHMTMLLALGRLLQRKPVAKGRVVLMFQPAEEDGSGARAVVNDPAFEQIAPDWAFAIHNEPGRPFGHVSTRAGLINCASQGLAIRLKGVTTHAATPEEGVSPVPVVAELIPALNALGVGGELDDAFRLVTITHVHVGEPTFGIAPGDAVIHATLRTARDEAMEDMVSNARRIAEEAGQRAGLRVSFEDCDVFAASINDAEATRVAREAMDALGISHGEDDLPMRASEDFGVFGWNAKAAMLCLGPGEDYTPLHNPDFDFPDDLIPIGAGIFERIARDLLEAVE
ncbi:amidohydrolase [Alisedimentitalea sp. MJ-SS2]|uniref:amidohydrolase n=1 Tax=Aliisedimentitalea sp. MJ-SS2 TaxID=3049795 RepID=UPI00291347B5|nr:amidohydrolase [Alisedimentitalea sp. MJ-SS2]MDU8927411.1 amidohydrolase [Alisedimentitalea sp. MJ-SS2]